MPKRRVETLIELVGLNLSATVTCGGCGHVREIEGKQLKRILLAKHIQVYSLDQIGRHMRCTFCGERRAKVTAEFEL